jgi:superfamily II DNA or RNA helicase
VKIEVGDITSKVIKPRSHLSELALIREACRARPDGFQFMPKYQAGTWDGYISLMSSWSSFPTGLLTLVVSLLMDNDIEFELLRQPRPDFQYIDENCLNGVKLRDYQLDATHKLLEGGRGVAKMATNSGKTEVIAAIIKALDIPPTVIIVHRKELLYQTAYRLEDRLGLEIGTVGDGRRDWQHKIVIAMVQTLHNLLPSNNSMFDGNELLVADECHHVSSDTMLDVMRYIPGPYRFGLSGTPLRYNVLADMKLIAATGDIVVEVTNDFMIESGWSAKPTICMYIIEELSEQVWDMEYTDAYASLIVENRVRNDIITNCAIQAQGVVLILVNQIKHGEILRDAIEECIFVHGSDSTEYRQSILSVMRDASKGIFIASPIFDEGIDVPAVDTIILAGGGKAHTKLLQRIGRGLRQKDDGRNELDVIDFIDDTNKYLLKHSQERIDVYGREGFEVQIQS